MRVVLTGGGTGGHLLPFEAIISALRSQFAQQQSGLPKRLDRERLEIFFVGPANESARAFFSSQDVRVIHVPSGKLRRYASGLTVWDLLWRLPFGIMRASFRMYFVMPDVIVSLGGYGSVPTVLAAVFYRIPILLHEMNAVVGLANRKLSRYAAAVTLGLQATQLKLGKRAYKGVVTGNPVREDIRRLNKTEARQQFRVAEGDHVLLVVGGSQGAKQINEVLLQVLPQLVLDVMIIHLTGKDHFQAIDTVTTEMLAQSSRQHSYRAFPYLTDTMAHALVAADSIVSRAGASTLSEIASLRTPALLVPLSGAAEDHQRANAQVFESAGAALVLDPENLTRNLFENNVRRLISDTELRQELMKNLAALDRPDAAQKIAGIALQLSQGFAPAKP